MERSLRTASMTVRMCRTASTMLPVPASPLVRIIAAPSADAPQRLSEVPGAADEGDAEGVLVDVVRLVRGREHLALVNVVCPEGLEDLRLDEVADPRLGHDRDRHGLHDALDERGIAHARHSARRPDVGRHPFQRHDRHRAGLLGDPRVLRA